MFCNCRTSATVCVAGRSDFRLDHPFDGVKKTFRYRVVVFVPRLMGYGYLGASSGTVGAVLGGAKVRYSLGGSMNSGGKEALETSESELFLEENVQL